MASRRKLPWKWWPPETKTMGAIAQNESPEANGQIVWGTPLDLKDSELYLNVLSFVKFGTILHKSCGALH